MAGVSSTRMIEKQQRGEVNLHRSQVLATRSYEVALTSSFICMLAREVRQYTVQTTSAYGKMWPKVLAGNKN